MKRPINNAYREKLRDPRWQKLRLQVFERDGWKCINCNTGIHGKKTLCVHHWAYIRGREPWDYPLTNFATMCWDCHQKEHDERPMADAVVKAVMRRIPVAYADLIARELNGHIRRRGFRKLFVSLYAMRDDSSFNDILTRGKELLANRVDPWADESEDANGSAGA